MRADNIVEDIEDIQSDFSYAGVPFQPYMVALRGVARLFRSMGTPVTIRNGVLGDVVEKKGRIVVTMIRYPKAEGLEMPQRLVLAGDGAVVKGDNETLWGSFVEEIVDKFGFVGK